MIDPTLRSNNYLEQVSRQSNAAGGKAATDGTQNQRLTAPIRPAMRTIPARMRPQPVARRPR
ncbi:hypothetical protein PCI56_11235 [Plesiomonas shigelloides subsp. oncorhynchi]|nr:hypothetical protein [Plesiomonas shigelloides]